LVSKFIDPEGGRGWKQAAAASDPLHRKCKRASLQLLARSYTLSKDG
jgi:hypothetical protein